MPQTSELHVTICPKVKRPQPICIGPNKYKCQFCNRKGEYAALVAHVQTHEKTAIEFQEKKIYKCNLGCRKNSHFHCCCCKRTIISRICFTEHIHKCRLSINRQVPTQSGSSLISSTLPALLGHSAPPVNTSVAICSDNNASDTQCGEDGATGTFDVKSPSPPSSAASLTVSITPPDSKDYIMSVNPSHSMCAASLKGQTPRATRITCCFCNLSLNKKNVKSHMQRRHMSANPDLQMNGLSHTRIASGLVFSIFCAVSVFVSFCSGTILPQIIESVKIKKQQEILHNTPS